MSARPLRQAGRSRPAPRRGSWRDPHPSRARPQARASSPPLSTSCAGTIRSTAARPHVRTSPNIRGAAHCATELTNLQRRRRHHDALRLQRSGGKCAEHDTAAGIPLIDPLDPAADPKAAALPSDAQDAQPGVPVLNVHRALANHPDVMGLHGRGCHRLVERRRMWYSVGVPDSLTRKWAISCGWDVPAGRGGDHHLRPNLCTDAARHQRHLGGVCGHYTIKQMAFTVGFAEIGSSSTQRSAPVSTARPWTSS